MPAFDRNAFDPAAFDVDSAPVSTSIWGGKQAGYSDPTTANTPNVPAPAWSGTPTISGEDPKGSPAPSVYVLPYLPRGSRGFTRDD